MTTIGPAGLAVVALALAAGPAGAQQVGPAVGAGEVTARALETEARDRAVEAGEFLQAGALLREAAQLRGEADPEAVRDLRDAGLFAYYGGNHRQAVTDMVNAGDRAAKLHEPVDALRSYLDAAWMAARTGEGRWALDLAHRAREIFHRERLDAAEFPELAVRLEELEGLSGD